jgi:putative transposase
VPTTLKEALAKICADLGATLDSFDGEDDPGHLLVRYPPKEALAKLVNSLKGASA